MKLSKCSAEILEFKPKHKLALEIVKEGVQVRNFDDNKSPLFRTGIKIGDQIGFDMKSIYEIATGTKVEDFTSKADSVSKNINFIA